MKMQEATKRETMHIGVGVLGLCLVMNLIFLLCGAWTMRVLWSTLLGGGWAVINFILLAFSVQIAAAAENEKRGKLKLQLSYSLRMLGTLAVVVVGLQVSCFHWLPVVLPLLFPRITILGMQLLGMYKPEKKQERGDGV